MFQLNRQNLHRNVANFKKVSEFFTLARQKWLGHCHLDEERQAQESGFRPPWKPAQGNGRYQADGTQNHCHIRLPTTKRIRKQRELKIARRASETGGREYPKK
jgi:hypothetical protein